MGSLCLFRKDIFSTFFLVVMMSFRTNVVKIVSFGNFAFGEWSELLKLASWVISNGVETKFGFYPEKWHPVI